MAEPRWIFLEHRPGYKHREAMQGEFFSASSELGALIRESIQNSLDARNTKLSTGHPVRMRIYYSGDVNSLPPSKHDLYFSEAWEHFHCEGSGLADPPSRRDPCPFLVLEDFNTTGLIGDINQTFELKGVKNPFYYFFRAEGQSGKSDQDRGRWGIGKFVFPRGSRLRTFLAVTNRSDDGKTYLVGQSILKSRAIGNRYYTPDGWLGISKDDSTFQLPVSDEVVISRAVDDFNLKRTNREPGLSIIIPWCEPVFNDLDDSERITRLVYEVVSEYFYAIISGKLVVEVESSGLIRLIDSNFIREEALNGFRQLRSFLSEERAKQISMTINWIDKNLPNIEIQGEEPRTALSWSDNYLGDAAPPKIRHLIESEKTFSLTVPVFVKLKSRSDSIKSAMTVIMGPPSSGADGRPLFIRDGLVISDVRCSLEKSVTAVVITENNELSTLLGDAENPAHTQWNHETDKFKEKYKYGKSHLEFVRHSVKKIIQLVYKDSEGDLEDILSDIFFLPPDEDEPVRPDNKQTGQEGDDTAPPGNFPDSKSRYLVNPLSDGFVVRGRSENLESVRIETAYDRKGGNPLKKYNRLDYDVGSSQFTIDTSNADVISRKENIIEVKPAAQEFTVSVRGYSRERDVYVRCEEKGDS